MNTDTTLKAAIRQQALALGFDDCRFTSAEPPATLPHFDRWLEHERHGAMAYLPRSRALRGDPRQVLPGAKSVIVLAASYADGEEAAASPGISPGFVARYARFAEYHTVLGNRLEELAAGVRELGGAGVETRAFVDTGPVLERDLAQRAGLGFAGKHTNLIHRRLGNWLFLGEVLTTLELAPDASEANHCGRCVRCLNACPTQALVAPFQLDARRCLSYLTIEHRGPIPVELRPAIGARIFGCDDCLAACPWNRFARVGRLLASHRRPELATLDLIELLRLDAAGFQRRFAGTPLLRARHRGLRRNVCVALGNVGVESALPALAQAAMDREPLIAEHARWALARVESRLSTHRA